MSPPVLPVAGDPRLERLRARLDARRQALAAPGGDVTGLRERLDALRAPPDYSPRTGEPINESARRRDAAYWRRQEAILRGEVSVPKADLSLPAAAVGVGLTQLIPGAQRREMLEERVLEDTRPGELSREVSPALPERTIGAGTEPAFIGPTPARTGADVVAAAAAAGTAVREYGYLRALGPVARLAGGVVARAGALERRLFPRLAAKLDDLAFRSTATSRAAGAVSSAARGTAEAAGFGVGREVLEEGPSVEAVKRGAAYAPFGTGLGLVFGALGARSISAARAIQSRGIVPRVTDNPYEVLGVPPNASVAEINRAFKRRAKVWHPDLNKTAGANEIFQMFEGARDAAVATARGVPVGARAPQPRPSERPGAAPPPPRPAEPARPAPRPAPADLDAVANEARELSIIPTAQRTPAQQARYEELSVMLKAEGERMAAQEPPARTAEEVARAAEVEPPLPSDIIERERRRPEFERRQQQAAVEAERREVERRAPEGAAAAPGGRFRGQDARGTEEVGRAVPEAAEPPIVAPRAPERVEPREPLRAAAVGQAAAVVTPEARHPVQYAMVEADQLVPSHRPDTFARDPRYPTGVQERPYERDPSEQMKVVRHAQQFEPIFVVTDDPTAVNGPPVITPSGLVLGGNSRTMTMQRLYREGEGEALRAALIERAPAFGLDPEAIQRMERPVLVRVLAQEPEAGALPELVRQFNEVPTQELGTAAGAVAQARRMSPETVAFVGESLDPTETVAAWLDRPGVQRDLVQRFLADGVFTPQTVNRYVTASTLNREGKQFVERVLLGAVIPDASLIETAPPALLQKVGKVVGPVSQAAAVAPEWDLRALLSRALELGRVAEQQGLTPDDLASQYDLMGAEVEPEAVAFLQLLRSESAPALRQRFARYAAAARRAQPAAQGQVELESLAGEPPTPAEALSEAFGIDVLPEGAGGPGVRAPTLPYGAERRPALRLTAEPEGPEQGALFGEREGTPGARSLAQTEAAARSELESLRQRLATIDSILASNAGRPYVSADKVAELSANRRELAAQIAEREKLVNRAQPLTAEELRTQALAATEGRPTTPSEPGQAELFGPEVREAVSQYLASAGEAHIAQVFGSRAVAEEAAASGAQADRAVPTLDERRQVIRQEPKTWVDIRGKRLASPQDVRDVIGPFRQPRTETFHWPLTDDAGTVLATTMETSGAIDAVGWAEEQFPRLLSDLERRAQRVGATEIHAVHNHPSGNSYPSATDLAFTVSLRDMMDRAGVRLRLRHWVIDNDNVSEIVLNLPQAPGAVSGMVDEVVDDILRPYGRTQESLSTSDLRSLRWDASKVLARRHATRDKQKVTPPRTDQPDWTERGANLLRLPQDAADLAGRPPAGRVDVLYRGSNGTVIAAVPHNLDAALHPERWLDAETRALGALDAVFVLDARPQGVYHQVHEAVKAYRGKAAILDVVGFGGEGLPAVSAQVDFGYVPQIAKRKLRARQLGAEPPPYRVRGAAPTLPARAAAQAAELGEAPPRPAPAEADRVAEEPPSYKPAPTPLRRWLDAVREGRAFTARPEGQRPASRKAAVAAPDIGEGGTPAEALPTDVTVGGTTWTLQPISPVELVRMAHELLAGSKIFLRKYPMARGMFYGEAGRPRIGLHPELGRDYEQFAHTLAHEVGHLVDFVPDETLKRGNILGRIASLRDYLRSTIDALPTNPSKALTAQDRKQIRRAAEAKVGPQPAKDNKADLAAWQTAVSEEYARLIQDEMDARGLIGKERVREELIAVSTWWRPIDLEQATESQRRYRESSKELYADAVSVLLNSPGSLQARAPTFFESFLAYLERKPDVREVYQDIQRLLGDEEALMRARREELEADFQLGEAIRQAAEQRRQRQPLSNYLRQLFLTRTAPATAAESRKLGRGVAPWSEQRGVKLALQELNHGDNVNRLLLMDLVRDVHQPLADAGITIDQAGRYLLLRRIAEGDRGGMAEQAKAAIIDITGTGSWEAARSAYQKLEGTDQFDPELLEVAESGVLNPHGYTPEEARRTLDALAKELGAEKSAQLGELLGKMRAIVSKATDEAVKLGVYSQEAYDKTILPNRETYVPFAVLDYFNGRVSAGMRHQIGTVKGVANPYVSAILKAMSLNRLNEYQRAKLALLSILDQFPDIGPERVIDRYHREQRPAGGRANLTYYKDGRLHYREVDEYLVRVLDKSDLGAVQRFTAAVGSMTYRFFHPLYVTWSVAWQMRNLPRDWKRTYKNLSVAHAGKPTYRQAVEMFLDLGRFARAAGETFGAAYRHARRRDPALIRLMLQDRALGRAFHSFEPLPTSETVNQLAQRYGILKPPPEPVGHRLREAVGAGGVRGLARGVVEAAKIAGRGARRALSPLETVGVMQETWTKAAAYKLLGRLGITGRERAYMVRNYTGTPDSTDAGLASESVNALFMYANVISAGWRADFEVATNPRTASGYWMRAVLIDFLPKLIMAAAALGWLGEEYKEWMAHVPQYEKEKYIIVPLPPFYAATPDGGRKAIYLRIPHDDVNRVLAAVTWAFAMDDRPYAPSRAVGTVAGEFPGINPGIELPVQWVQFMSNRNPYDAFRGRDVVPQTEWEAGGWPRMRKMLKYTWGEFGIVSQATDWAGAATGYSMQADERAAGERTIGAIPGISALLKFSDRGLTEDAWSEVAWERQQRAQLRASLSEPVRRASRERQRLNTLGEDRLNARDRKRRNRLNTWYRRYYLPLTAEMELRRDAGDQKGYQAVADRINASVERIEALPSVPPRRGGPRPPQPPRPPRPRRPR